jgi:phosphoribosyl-AMP cyclohydrolase
MIDGLLEDDLKFKRMKKAIEIATGLRKTCEMLLSIVVQQTDSRKLLIFSVLPSSKSLRKCSHQSNLTYSLPKCVSKKRNKSWMKIITSFGTASAADTKGKRTK